MADDAYAPGAMPGRPTPPEGVDELSALLRTLELNERRAPAAAAGGAGAGSPVGGPSKESRCLVPEVSLTDFLHPRTATTHVRIPTYTGDIGLFLTAAERNVLAEYMCFIKSASPEAYYLPVNQVEDDAPPRRGATAGGYDDTGMSAGSGTTEAYLGVDRLEDDVAGAGAGAGGGLYGTGARSLKRVAVKDLGELHNHVGVLRGQLVVIRHVAARGRLRIILGGAWPGSPIRAAHDFPSGTLFDLGYIGDSMNELAACRALRTCAPTPLLLAVADPRARRAIAFREPTAAELSLDTWRPIPINALQLGALAGMRFEIEGVQGPPGTGKSTLIFHAVRTFILRTDTATGERAVVLATCVQNKAVDAIAEKLAIGHNAATDAAAAAAAGGAGAAGAAAAGPVEPPLPFVVFGNDERLSAVAKQWTAQAQMLRDPRVVALTARVRRQRDIHGILAGAIERGAGRLRRSKTHQARMMARAIRRHGDPANTRDKDLRFAIEERIAAFMRRDLWAMAYARAWALNNPRVVAAEEHVRRVLRTRMQQLVELQKQVTAETIANARCILCTVATASRSLLTDEQMIPAAERITTAILDEAGTCPDTKLPLLLMLPRLRSLIAIGDQAQLPPFTRWSREAAGGGDVGGYGARGTDGRPLCHSFAATRRCRHGMMCRFSHALPAGRHVAAAAAGGAGAGDALTEPPRGFFQRLTEALPAGAVPCLAEQYRMHPVLCAYVSSATYGGALSTPAAVAATRMAADPTGLYWVGYPVPAGGAESKAVRGHSTVNHAEVRLALRLFQLGEAAGYLCTPPHAAAAGAAAGGAGAGGAGGARGGAGAPPPRTARGRSVAIITLYKEQEKQLRALFLAAGIREREAEASADDPIGAFRILTVDQAQGQEADVVILSCVRSNPERRIGFTKSPNRLNVAVSRARERLVIIGDAATLRSEPRWAALIAACHAVGSPEELPAMALRR